MLFHPAAPLFLPIIQKDEQPGAPIVILGYRRIKALNVRTRPQKARGIRHAGKEFL